MKKIEKLLKTIEGFSTGKKDRIKQFKTIEALRDEYKFYHSERLERLIIWAVSWGIGTIFVIVGFIGGQEPTDLSGSVSGSEQSGSLNVQLDIFFFALFCFVFILPWTALRKWKAGKEENK